MLINYVGRLYEYYISEKIIISIVVKIIFGVKRILICISY